MPKTKAQKKQIVEKLGESLTKQKSVVLFDYKGLKVGDMNALRKDIKKNDGKLEATKKTLVNLVAKKGGFDFGETLSGHVAMAFSFKDVIAPIKAVYTLSKTNENVKILAGIFEGKIISKEDVIALAQLPSREELLAKLVGSVSSPMSGLLNVFQGNVKGLVYVLSNIKK